MGFGGRVVAVLLVVVVAWCGGACGGSAAGHVKPRHPIVLVAGVGGSHLQAQHVDAEGKVDDTTSVWVRLSRAGHYFRRFMWGQYTDAGRLEPFEKDWRVVAPMDDHGLYAIDLVNPDLLIGTGNVEYFHSLIESLTEQVGYEKGKTLFGFPYDWRQSTGDPVHLAGLHQQLQRASAAAGGVPVDIVSHSMGGLLVKAYLAWAGTRARGLVRRWVTFSTPWRGAGMRALNAFIEGYNFGNMLLSSWDAHQLVVSMPGAYELLADTHYAGWSVAKGPPRVTVRLRDSWHVFTGRGMLDLLRQVNRKLTLTREDDTDKVVHFAWNEQASKIARELQQLNEYQRDHQGAIPPSLKAMWDRHEQQPQQQQDDEEEKSASSSSISSSASGDVTDSGQAQRRNNSSSSVGSGRDSDSDSGNDTDSDDDGDDDRLAQDAGTAAAAAGAASSARRVGQTGVEQAGVEFINVYGIGLPTPFHVTYEDSVDVLDKLLTVAPSSTSDVPGDGTVPEDSAAGDALGAVHHTTFTGLNHVEILKDAKLVSFVRMFTGMACPWAGTWEFETYGAPEAGGGQAATLSIEQNGTMVWIPGSRGHGSSGSNGMGAPPRFQMAGTVDEHNVLTAVQHVEGDAEHRVTATLSADCFTLQGVWQYPFPTRTASNPIKARRVLPDKLSRDCGGHHRRNGKGNGNGNGDEGEDSSSSRSSSSSSSVSAAEGGFDEDDGAARMQAANGPPCDVEHGGGYAVCAFGAPTATCHVEWCDRGYGLHSRKMDIPFIERTSLFARNTSVCTACAVGTYGTGGAAPCRACTNKPEQAVYVAEHHGTAACPFKCDKGHFLEDAGAHAGSRCVACPVGTYKNVIGNASCKQCQNAPANAVYVAAHEALCVWVCAAGFEKSADGLQCNSIVVEEPSPSPVPSPEKETETEAEAGTAEGGSSKGSGAEQKDGSVDVVQSNDNEYTGNTDPAAGTDGGWDFRLVALTFVFATFAVIFAICRHLGNRRRNAYNTLPTHDLRTE